jgi:hypothetical protein
LEHLRKSENIKRGKDVLLPTKVLNKKEEKEMPKEENLE